MAEFKLSYTANEINEKLGKIAVPDWNQTDETAADFIKNKPDVLDGFSPTVSVTDITGGHRVTITDKGGEKTFDVMDGQDGTGGSTEGGGSAEWEVLQQVSVPADAEETQDFNITFPKGYDAYLVIANLEATSTSSSLILYPATKVLTDDGAEGSGMMSFWDYYPGTNACRISMYFEQMVISEEVYVRMHGLYGHNAKGKPNNHQDSGWYSYDTYPTPRPLVRWAGIKINRLIAPGSGYTLLGRKSL